MKKFRDKNPKLEDFEEKLKEFQNIQNKINEIESIKQIGALNLKTESLKFGLNNWVKVWKDAFAKDLHKKAKISLSDLSDHFKGLKLKLEKPAKDIDSLGHIMSALEEIRKNESSIEMEIRPIKEMYSMIEFYIADALEKEEGESKDILDKGWKELVTMGETIRNDLQKK